MRNSISHSASGRPPLSRTDSRLARVLTAIGALTIVAVSLVVVSPAVAGSPAPAAATATPGHWYGGYYAPGPWQGVDGYIQQPSTPPLHTAPPSGHTPLHAAWIGIDNGTLYNWVQIGTMQGGADGWWSPSKPIIYTENPDPCGYLNAASHGTPPSSDYAYYVYYDGASNIVNCGSSGYAAYYDYEFKAGSINNPPLTYGYLGVLSGQAQINTEIYPTHDVPIGVDYYGCDAAHSCSSFSYGVHVYDGSWHAFTPTYAATLYEGDPPWPHTHISYWAFHTCPSQC